MAAFYDLGDSVKLTFLVEAGDPLVPTNATVVLTVTAPDGTISTPAISNPATGTYIAAVAASQAGLWLYRWTATGAATTAEDGQFHVRAAAAANVYTTLAELKVSLSIGATDTQDDDDLQDAILVASRAVENDCRRHFHKIAETRTLAARDPRGVRLGEYMDLVSVTTLKTDVTGDGTFETTWTASDYQLLCQDGTPNVNAAPEPRPYQRIKAIGTLAFPIVPGYLVGRADLVQIAGVWGWPQVPDDIRRATRLMAAETFKLRDAPFGAVGFAELGIIRVRDNPKYQKLIRDYRLVEAAVPFA